MAFVRVSYHRQRQRVAPHVRYIASRDDSSGLRGIGPAFRALGGDVERAIALMHEHAGLVRKQAGATMQEGPFWRLLLTLPTPEAERVASLEGRLPGGGARVMQDAFDATMRSVGRHLQGVYAVHFNSNGRRAHPHIHADLSPLDVHGRRTFVTARQRELFRSTWEREIERVLARAERRACVAPLPEPDAKPWTYPGHTPRHVRGVQRAGSAPAEGSPELSRRPRRQRLSYLATATSLVLGWSGLPLVDLFARALVSRYQARLLLPLPCRAARAGFGLTVAMPRDLPTAGAWARGPALFPVRWP
jgi:hypothetical protein